VAGRPAHPGKWKKALFLGISLQIRSLATAALTLGKKKPRALEKKRRG
jgi:hypothetical protein